MVQLGVKTNKGRGIFEFFFAKSQPEVDREWVAENQLKMARLFMAGLEKYNLESGAENLGGELDESGATFDDGMKRPANEELASRTVTEAIYTNLLVGFSSEIQCLVLMKVDADLTRFGEVFVFYPKDFAKKKYRRFIERFEIYDQTEKWYERILMRLSAKHRTTFYVPSESLGTLTDVEGNPVLIYMSQAKMRERFVEFFNNWEQK